MSHKIDSDLFLEDEAGSGHGAGVDEDLDLYGSGNGEDDEDYKNKHNKVVPKPTPRSEDPYNRGPPGGDSNDDFKPATDDSISIGGHEDIFNQKNESQASFFSQPGILAGKQNNMKKNQRKKDKNFHIPFLVPVPFSHSNKSSISARFPFSINQSLFIFPENLSHHPTLQAQYIFSFFPPTFLSYIALLHIIRLLTFHNMLYVILPLQPHIIFLWALLSPSSFP